MTTPVIIVTMGRQVAVLRAPPGVKLRHVPTSTYVHPTAHGLGFAEVITFDDAPASEPTVRWPWYSAPPDGPLLRLPWSTAPT